ASGEYSIVLHAQYDPGDARGRLVAGSAWTASGHGHWRHPGERRVFSRCAQSGYRQSGNVGSDQRGWYRHIHLRPGYCRGAALGRVAALGAGGGAGIVRWVTGGDLLPAFSDMGNGAASVAWRNETDQRDDAVDRGSGAVVAGALAPTDGYWRTGQACC